MYQRYFQNQIKLRLISIIRILFILTLPLTFIPCNHCSNWTWVVENNLVYGNRLLLRTAGSSLIWNYAEPLTSLELLKYYLTLAVSSGRFCILCHSLQCVERSLVPKKAKMSSTTHVQLLQWLHGIQQQHVSVTQKFPSLSPFITNNHIECWSQSNQNVVLYWSIDGRKFRVILLSLSFAQITSCTLKIKFIGISWYQTYFHVAFLSNSKRYKPDVHIKLFHFPLC